MPQLNWILIFNFFIYFELFSSRHSSSQEAQWSNWVTLLYLITMISSFTSQPNYQILITRQRYLPRLLLSTLPFHRGMYYKDSFIVFSGVSLSLYYKYVKCANLHHRKIAINGFERVLVLVLLLAVVLLFLFACSSFLFCLFFFRCFFFYYSSFFFSSLVFFFLLFN